MPHSTLGNWEVLFLPTTMVSNYYSQFNVALNDRRRVFLKARIDCMYLFGMGLTNFTWRVNTLGTAMLYAPNIKNDTEVKPSDSQPKFTIPLYGRVPKPLEPIGHHRR